MTHWINGGRRWLANSQKTGCKSLLDDREDNEITKHTAYTPEFPPRRKWMEVLPLRGRLPSCLCPLSRSEGTGLIRTLGKCYCFTHSRTPRILACVVQRQPETGSPLFTKGQIFDPICFCCSFFRGTFLCFNIYSFFLRYLLETIPLPLPQRVSLG